jgi:hypothetical protein
MKSEEQWVEVDQCEGCKAPIYRMGDKQICPGCRCNGYIFSRLNPINLQRLVKDICNVT